MRETVAEAMALLRAIESLLTQILQELRVANL